MPRIPLFSTESMTAEQERVYREIVDGRRGKLVGPLRASLHNPALADRWQKFGEILRYDTSLPRRLNELAILVTARHWNAQLEWHIHAPAAIEAGLRTAVVEALRRGTAPVFDDAAEAEVYEFARALQLTGNVPDDIYRRVELRWGAVGVVELSSVIGYYTLVAMTLNVHEIPLPDGADLPLPVAAGEPVLSRLPASRAKRSAEGAA